MKKIFKTIFLGILVMLVASLVSLGNPKAAQAFHVPYGIGDVFAGVGGGQVYHYDSTGVLLEALNTTSGSSEETGMCFDSASNLYTTNWTAGNMTKFNNLGGLLTFPWGGPFSVHPESCVVDALGNIYTGEVDGASDIQKWDSSGASLGSFSPATGPRGVDWIDLASDQCTMLYTSEGTSVKSFDVCANLQNPDFASGLAGPCFALRIRSNGEVLVTCSTKTYRLDSTGAEIQNYPIAGESLFAMNLDPDGAHFWTGGYTSRNIYKVNIATGVGTGAPVFTAAVVGPTLAGLAIFGEPTAAQPEITLDPPTATNPAGTNHTVTATIKAGGNPVVGTLVSFSVTAGPNVGQVSDPGECSIDPGCNTDALGQTSWTYTSNGATGVDVIQACFADATGALKCAEAEKEWVDETPPTAACIETVNPHGKTVPPAGKTTLPGPRGGDNEDGFYELLADDLSGIISFTISDAFGSGPFLVSPGDKVKITEAPGGIPSSKPMGSANGLAGAIATHITLLGDAILTAVDGAGNVTVVSCLVPPPPK